MGDGVNASQLTRTVKSIPLSRIAGPILHYKRKLQMLPRVCSYQGPLTCAEEVIGGADEGARRLAQVRRKHRTPGLGQQGVGSQTLIHFGPRHGYHLGLEGVAQVVHHLEGAVREIGVLAPLPAKGIVQFQKRST